MKKILRIFTSLTVLSLVSVNVSGCGIRYERLNKDISKWDTDTIFSNSALLQAIDESTFNLKKSFNVFRSLFEHNYSIKDLKETHKKLPNVYFLVEGTEDNEDKIKPIIYVRSEPIIDQAIINYESHTKTDNESLNSVTKIQQNILLKYYTENPSNPNIIKDNIYLKSENIKGVQENGIIKKTWIYQPEAGVAPTKDDWLLTRFNDSQGLTPGYISVATLMRLTITHTENSPDHYFNFLIDRKLLVTISWF